MNTSRKGNAGDLLVIRELTERKFVVGSRRHIGGPGDLLAVRWESHDVATGLLIEVKATRTPFQNFKPRARFELWAYATTNDLEPLLGWVTKGRVIYWPVKTWPTHPADAGAALVTNTDN